MSKKLSQVEHPWQAVKKKPEKIEKLNGYSGEYPDLTL